MAGDVDPLGKRKGALAAFLETKVGEGFAIETHTDTHAILVGPRRKSIWSRLRAGNSDRYVVQVDEHGRVSMTTAEPRRSQATLLDRDEPAGLLASVGKRDQQSVDAMNALSSVIRPLATGAEIRVTRSTARGAVVCVNGGQRREVAGTWSATLEWLVRRLAPRFPELGFAEVRYRIKSWKRMDWCVADARAAIRESGAPRTLLLGFSMGGAVAVCAADEGSVEGVVALAPWLPDRLRLDPLVGRRLAVIHGGLDRSLPGVPGIRPESSRRGFERALALGVEGSYTLIPGAVHGAALRSPRGAAIPLPRARRWADAVSLELARFQASVG